MSKLHYDSNDRDDGSIDACPFCWGEAEVQAFTPFLRSDTYYFVKCSVCGAMSYLYCKSPAEALARWNRRVK